MSTSGGSAVGGALSLMGCVREASPPPQDSPSQGEFSAQQPLDAQPKEPKKRRFHPLRGLRKIFRRKSRGAADLNAINGTEIGDIHSRDREEVTLRHPDGRAEETRSRSASELLTESCDRDSSPGTGWTRPFRVAISLNFSEPYDRCKEVFMRRSRAEEAFAKLRGGPGQLSVSHDSVFPGEVPRTRPLSSMDPLATLERRPSKISEKERAENSTSVTQRHRISLQVLEQIKTVIEGRNQVSNTETMPTHNRSTKAEKRPSCAEETPTKTVEPCPSEEKVEQIPSEPEDKLPELESGRLSHTAAKHRMTIRPKNRRPPRRSASQRQPTRRAPVNHRISAPAQSFTRADAFDGSPVESKNVTVIRKSSSRLAKKLEPLGEVLTQRISPTGSSDSLDVTLAPRSSETGVRTCETLDTEESVVEARPVYRNPSNKVFRNSDMFLELSAKLPRRRSASHRVVDSPDSLENGWSRSTDSLDRLDESSPSKPSTKRPSNPASKSIDRASSKSSDSLEIAKVNSDDSIERRSSYEFRSIHRTHRGMSKSSENFEILEEIQARESSEDLEVNKVSSSELDLARENGKMSKSVESIEEKSEAKRSSSDLTKRRWRPKRSTVSSESSDNLEQDDELEARRVRKPPRRLPSTSVVDVTGPETRPRSPNAEAKPLLTRKPSRFEKSSESSELGSTETLDSEKRHKLSASTETLDSLEKDLDNEDKYKNENEKDDESIDVLAEKRERDDMWPARGSEPSTPDPEDTKGSITEKSYWQQSSDAKDNMDIHRLLAITIVTHMADNGNNQRNTVIFPKKKLSPPTSPTKQEQESKILFNNLLSSKNDEDLQNMLNGNISEVSTDTKSFKEKLIMFEKLGK